MFIKHTKKFFKQLFEKTISYENWHLKYAKTYNYSTKKV